MSPKQPFNRREALKLATGGYLGLNLGGLLGAQSAQAAVSADLFGYNVGESINTSGLAQEASSTVISSSTSPI